MSRIVPVHWKVLECIFLKDGFSLERQGSSHRVYVKANIARPVVIPTYKNVGVDIITSNMRTAKMNREKYFDFLAECSN